MQEDRMGKAGVDTDVCYTIGDEVKDESDNSDWKMEELKFVYESFMPDFIKSIFQIEQN